MVYINFAFLSKHTIASALRLIDILIVMLLYLVLIIIFLCALDWYIKNNETIRMIRKLPSVNERFLIGHALSLLVSPVELFKKPREWAEAFNGIYGWWCPMVPCVNIYRPEDVEIVISSTKNNEKSVAYKVIRNWLREGLLVSAGLKWHQRRKILTPAFHFNILKRFFVIMEENSERLTEELEKTNGEAIDIIPVISNYTLNAICETAMGTRLHDEALTSGRTYKQALYKLGQMFVYRFSRLYLLHDVPFNLSPAGRDTKKQLNTVRTFTKNVINERKKYIEENGLKFPEENDEEFIPSNKKRIAMLDLLISAQKDGIIDDVGVQEEVDTFMFEGHDTSAAGLTYCLMLLANHKDVQDKIVEELNSIFGESDRQATITDLSMMKYLECCVKESLRLYPPVHFIGRRIDEKITLSGYTINPGTHCHIHIYDLHRREDLFPNASTFDPDRFLPENSIGRHPYAYIPFSAGPRNCIGQRFAMMEMKSCLSSVLRRFELKPITKPEDIEFVADLVLRTSKPVYVQFVKRQ